MSPCRRRRFQRLALHLAARAHARTLRERLHVLALGPPTTDALEEERQGLVTAMFSRGLTSDEAARKAEIEAELDRRDGPLVEAMDAQHERTMRRLDRLRAAVEALGTAITTTPPRGA